MQVISPVAAPAPICSKCSYGVRKRTGRCSRADGVGGVVGRTSYVAASKVEEVESSRQWGGVVRDAKVSSAVVGVGGVDDE